MRKLNYFVAVSLDGYIASPDGGFEAFPMQGDHIEALVRDYPETLPAPALSAMGVTADNNTFDTVLMGWNTYDVGRRQGLGSPYPHLRQYVCTRSHAALDVPADVQLVSDDPRALVRRLKADSSSRDIWLCGGGRLAAVLVDDIDALVLKVNPVCLGRGVPLFATDQYKPRAFSLQRTRSFESGVVMSYYARN